MNGSRSPTPTTRRPFLKALLYLSSVPFLGLVQVMLRRDEIEPEASETVRDIPYVPTPGIRFYDRVVVTNCDDKLAVFSTACPHLGCRIDRSDGGELVCPCHGSRFSPQGSVVRGPAGHGLQALKFEYDRTHAVLRVVLKNV